MNIMRKIRAGVSINANNLVGGGGGSATSSPPGSGAAGAVVGAHGGGGVPAGGGGGDENNSGSGGTALANNGSSLAHTQLGLMHLKKLFTEYTHPAHPLNDAERCEKLYSMLPLFCKVFGSSPISDMTEKFWDIQAFCQQVSMLMVEEIRKRASSPSTEAASCAIAKFLEIESCEESSNGWMLLSTLNLLAAGDSALVTKMSELAVPSTLVKCLYLFCDLPPINEQNANIKDSNSDFTPNERRILLQKIFVQLLVRLCSHRVPAEELARTDDLTLLFTTITSTCQTHNVMWRKSAAEVLVTLSRHGLTPPVVRYIHTKSCISLCIDNMRHSPDLPPLDLMDMFITVFCFLKDSSDVSSQLMDDFRQAQGYLFLSEFLLKLENESSSEAQEVLRNLILILASLCMCGFMELKPSQASTGSLFRMQGFTVPQPSGRGNSVRNIQAFHVLQSTFLKSASPLLCTTILDAISGIYHADNANYFILENQNTLSQFTERIHHKSADVQQKLFELVIFLVEHLNFIPCKELISMSIFLKTHSMNQPECSVRCVQSLIDMLKMHVLFKEVYREVGLLEVFVTCLNRYGNLLETRYNSPEFVIPSGQERLGNMVIDGMAVLLAGNASNAAVLRECGGAKCVHGLVSYAECRQKTLTIVRELLLCTGGDDDMGQLIETIHTSPRNAWQLKTDILRAIVSCLKESHRCRTVFRKANGFVNVTSILVTLEHSLSGTYVEPKSEILALLHTVCYTLATAMRFEPANARHFQHEICSTTLCDTLRLLGCFGDEQIPAGAIMTAYERPPDEQCDDALLEALQSQYQQIFVDGMLNLNIPILIPNYLAYAVSVYRLLYDIALDLFDKPAVVNSLNRSPCLSRQTSSSEPTPSPSSTANGSMIAKRSAVNSLNLNPPPPDPIIVHPGIVVVMLQLMPYIQSNEPGNSAAALAMQLYVSELIKSLVRSERNQQLMCDAGLVAKLLEICAIPLQTETHPLHSAVQYMLERLSAQALDPTDLRLFLRLGDPLSSCPLEESSNTITSGPVPLTRITTIVSMTTPKDIRAQSAATMPPFVEFDMSAEGFGCLFLPSIAPQPANVGSVVAGMDTSVLGGIGTGDRMFPPQTGLTFSTWICVDKFSDPRTDQHCVRLLTLVRNLNSTRDEQLVCLSVVLSARDKAIIVSTQETHIPHHISEWEPDGSGDHGARVWCPDMLHEGQWHHLAIVLNRAVLKNSSFSLYVDGKDVHSQKLHYISQNPGGGGAANLTMASSVYGFIGTPPAWRRFSRLCWKQGPCHLLEEVLAPSTVAYIHHLGPHYMGSFQAATIAGLSCSMFGGGHPHGLNHGPGPGGAQGASAAVLLSNPLTAAAAGSIEPVQLVSEDKVMFGLNAKAVNHLTLSRIRKVYNRVDNKSIAKQLGMSSHENATPIRILHNSAGHLAGAARTLGGVVVGYLGVRVFNPRPVATIVDCVGGCSVLLGMIAHAHTIESLYAAVKALVCVVRTNRVAQAEMDRRRGYQTLGMLLKLKRSMLNAHILHLAFGLVGTVDSLRESSGIPNLTAFQDLLCDLDIWAEAPGELLRSHLEHLYELAAESSEKRHNTWIMRDLQLVAKLLHITPDVRHSVTRNVLFALLATLLGGGSGQVRQSDLLLYGQFVASLLPADDGISEKSLLLNSSTDSSDDCDASDVERVHLRNRCLSLLMNLLCTSRNTVNLMLCDEISKTLGFDWVLLFMQRHLHASTVTLAVRMLVLMCSTPTLMNRFRDSTHNGGWLRHELLANNKMSQTLGGTGSVSGQQSTGSTDSDATTAASNAILAAATAVSAAATAATSPAVNTNSSTANHKRHDDALYVPGFQKLGWLLPEHLELPALYYLLTALMMGQPALNKSLPSANSADAGTFNLDSVWAFLWGGSSASMSGVKVNLCAEAVVVLLAMARAMLHCDHQPPLPEWLRNHPTSIIQVLFEMYHNMPDFMPIFMSAEVLGGLAGVLFPPAQKCDSLDSSSGASTPGDDASDSLAKLSLDADVTPSLTTHPARQFIMDFIRVIVVDSLSLAVTAKTASPVIDIVLDAFPESATHSQQVAYQTEILVKLMDHLLAADMLVGDQAAIPVVPLAGAHVQHVAPNVFYLTARIVDKMWQGALLRDPHEVFDFIVKLIGQAKRRTGNFSPECLYHCLNRAILYLLSRSTESIADQMSVLEALHKLTTNRLIVFGAGNHELDFVGCLSYCLLQLTADIKIAMDTNAKTTWHVNPSASAVEHRDEQLNNHQARNLMSGAALRVWEELYVCKKPAIEEVFRMTLPPITGNCKAPDLAAVREQVAEAAQKLWLNYIDAERKTTYRVPWELHNQIQSKIHKVAGGLTRLASRTKVRRDEGTRVRGVRVSKQQSHEWVQSNINLVKELTEIRRNQRLNTSQHTQKYVHQEWLVAESELTRERGLWGSPMPSILNKWMLDTTEGPNRMRKKLMRNDNFYRHYPYRPEQGTIKYKYATSHHSKLYHQALQRRSIMNNNGNQIPSITTTTLELQAQPLSAERTESVSTDDLNPPDQPDLATLPHQLARLKSDPDEQQDDLEIEEDQQQPPPDNKTLLRLLQENEKISYMFRCARIEGLDTTEGLLLFGLEHCYVVDGFTLLKNRDIWDIEQALPTVGYEPILPTNPGSPRRRTGGNSSSQDIANTVRQCSKFSYDDIREVHKRRYLLQPIALEVFSSDGRNHLLAFPRKIRNKVYQRFMTTATGMADSAQQSVAGQKRTAQVEQTAGLLSSLIGETSVTQRWVRGEISNFQYLMYLNTLAGRSYNDLMQYPVFPWIIADYDSEELDLTDPATFRDFRKPMGAQSASRLAQFKKRYKEWDDPHGETPPYHYGIHYSSAMIVCSYLVRMEPFTQHFLRLQGGHFDLADRMFHSIREAWCSASKHNMADVKELIPEFFYLPEFFQNSNQFDLGAKQSGVMLGDVVLPPWAKQDTREFIRVHRMALECDHVSQNLHHWIDLIFGYKQQGPPAVEAVNVFHHLFYEGNVDIYNIDDPLKKNATIGFINNFGQIPKQLFKKQHPAKKMGGTGNNRSSVIDTGSLVQAFSLPQPERLFFHHLDNLRPSSQPIKEVKSAVGQILHVDKASVWAVEENKVLIPPNYAQYVAWGFADHSLRIGNYDSDKAVFVSENCVQNSGEILACVCPSSKMIVTAGTSTVVTIWEYIAKRKQLTVKHSLYAHTEAVTCLATSPAYNVIISGSRDSSAVIWDLSRGIFVRQLRGHTGPVAAVAVNDLTGDIATCAGTWLHLWSINGDELATVNTCVGRADRMQQILCVAFSLTHEWDAMNVVMTGSTDGVTRMWSIDYVQVPDDEARAKMAEDAKLKPTMEPPTVVIRPTPLHSRLVKQIHVSTDSSGSGLIKSGSESSLSEDSPAHREPANVVDAAAKLEVTSKEWRSEQENEKETCSDTEEASSTISPPVAAVRRRRSRVHGGLRKSEGGNSADGHSLDVDDGGSMRTSKSDTSLTDSFVMIPDGKKKGQNPQSILRPGFKWQRQLVFRSKLTMHTAYDRKDNAQPASITALAVSKDHRTVFVGDARGRVYSFSVCEVPGRAPADHWLKDEGADYCAGCTVRFTIYERRHHCRNCGQVFCSKCSRFESEISRLRILKPVRVCQGCYAALKNQADK